MFKKKEKVTPSPTYMNPPTSDLGEVKKEIEETPKEETTETGNAEIIAAEKLEAGSYRYIILSSEELSVGECLIEQ